MDADFRFVYHQEQRQRFIDGQLRSDWLARYPDLFDAKDFELWGNQPRSHFYECLVAILLKEATGYLSLVEHYVTKTHPSKLDIYRSKVPKGIFDWTMANQGGLPDLFSYSPTSGDWFFLEVKGGTDSVRHNQPQAFAALKEHFDIDVKVAHLAPIRERKVIERSL